MALFFSRCRSRERCERVGLYDNRPNSQPQEGLRIILGRGGLLISGADSLQNGHDLANVDYIIVAAPLLRLRRPRVLLGLAGGAFYA